MRKFRLNHRPTPYFPVTGFFEMKRWHIDTGIGLVGFSQWPIRQQIRKRSVSRQSRFQPGVLVIDQIVCNEDQ